MRRLLPAVLCLGFAVGCGSKTPPEEQLNAPAAYDADAIADAAIAQLDKNRDGRIDATEMNACPALKGLAGGRAVTRDDLKRRIESYTSGAESVYPASVVVRRDDVPAEGVTVTLTPEPFMGATFKPASGVTKADGFAEIRVEGTVGVGVPYGFYKVTVSKKDAGGTETVPARFNAQSKDIRELYTDGRAAPSPLQIILPQ